MTQVLEKICIVCRREFPKDVHECPDDLVRLTEKDPLLGTVFDGKFEMIDFIGVGGLSRVYKARHVELNRIYAIKVLKSSDFIDLQRFRREAVSIGQLSHPNIGQVFSFSIANNGRPYMVLEYIDGKDLGDIIAKDGGLPPARAAAIFAQACAAISHAHTQGIIHRDIKPGNIIVLSHPQDEAEIKVVDFGMAKILNEGKDAQKITKTGEIFGTRQYISPEQYTGAPADERADIYALGISLKESFGKNSAPEQLKRIIDKATQSDPSKRYSSAEEMRQMLLSLLENPEAISTTAPDGNSRFPMTLLITIGLLIISAFSLLYVSSPIQTTPKDKQLAKQSISASVPLRFAAAESLADALIQKGNIAQAQDILERWFEKNKLTASSKEVAATAMQRASCYAALGQYRKADAVCDEMISIIEKMTESKVERESMRERALSLAAVYHSKARWLIAADKPEQARPCLHKSIELVKRIDNETARSFLVLDYSLLSQSSLQTGDLNKAYDWAMQSYAAAKETFGETSRATATAYESLGAVLIEQSKYKEAKPLVDLAVAIRKETTPPRESSSLISAILMQVQVELELGMKKRARKHFDELILLNQRSEPGLNKHLLERTVRRMNGIADEFDIPQNKRTWNRTSSRLPSS